MTDTSVPTLVETEWLATKLDDPSVRIVDATWLLPNAGRKGIDDYNAGHIPGAVFWDIDAIADPDSSLPHMMPDEATFERHMKALGVSNDQHVVVYDNVSMMTAPRVWWTLRAFGHARVSLLNGGQVKWQAEGRSPDGGCEPGSRYKFQGRVRPRHDAVDRRCPGESRQHGGTGARCPLGRAVCRRQTPNRGRNAARAIFRAASTSRSTG